MTYSTGTISCALGGDLIQGHQTFWQTTGNIKAGDILYLQIKDNPVWLSINTVLSDSQLTVATLDGQPLKQLEFTQSHYGIIQNFTHTTPAQLAAALQKVQSKWHRRERELTGWIASEDTSFPITGFMGDKITVPTPKYIGDLAQDAKNASQTLANMATEIEANAASLALVSPKIKTFDTRFATSTSQYQTVVKKHDEVIKTHDAVKPLSKEAELSAAHAQTHATSAKKHSEDALDSAQHASLNHQRTAAHSALAVSAADNAETAMHTAKETYADFSKHQAQFSKEFALSTEQFNAVTLKHSEVINTHATVKPLANQVKTLSEQVKDYSEQSLNAQKIAQSSAAEAKLNNQRAAAHSAIAVSAATNAERAESISVSTQQNIDKQKVALDAIFSELNVQQQALEQGLAGINDSEHRAIRAESACVMIQDQVTHTASQANTMLLQTQADAESATQAAIVTQEHQNYTALLAKQAAAHAALSALALDSLSSQQAHIKTAFNALLNNTLTKEQINTLFN